jgi:hypothetical protein
MQNSAVPSFFQKQRPIAMHMKSALALVVLSLSMTSPSLCQSGLRSQQQTACEDDAYRLCPDEIPDEAQVASCLARQKSKLSPGCRAMFTPSHRTRH